MLNKIDLDIYSRSIGTKCWLMNQEGEKNEFKFVRNRLE